MSGFPCNRPVTPNFNQQSIIHYFPPFNWLHPFTHKGCTHNGELKNRAGDQRSGRKERRGNFAEGVTSGGREELGGGAMCIWVEKGRGGSNVRGRSVGCGSGGGPGVPAETLVCCRYREAPTGSKGIKVDEAPTAMVASRIAGVLSGAVRSSIGSNTPEGGPNYRTNKTRIIIDRVGSRAPSSPEVVGFGGGDKGDKGWRGGSDSRIVEGTGGRRVVVETYCKG